MLDGGQRERKTKSTPSFSPQAPPAANPVKATVYMGGQRTAAHADPTCAPLEGMLKSIPMLCLGGKSVCDLADHPTGLLRENMLSTAKIDTV